FAQGGVTLAARLGCQALACGVETGTAAAFLSLARQADELETGPETVKKSSAGQQLTDALMAAAPDEAQLLQQPNALLAFEYARAILKQERPMAFLPLPRQGRHNDTGLGAAFASATALRQAMTAHPCDASSYISYISKTIRPSLQGQLAQGAFTDYGRYGDFVASQNRLLTPDQLRSLPAFTEGLENRWHRSFMESGSYDQALRTIKTRRYAYSRLCRMGAYTLLQPSRELMDQSYEAEPQYARLLALNRRGAAFLKGAKDHIPIVTKVRSDIPGLSPLGQEQLKLDLKASDIQSFCFSKENQRKGHQDYYHSPFFLVIQK
ncbi:nucleotidyltransferase family protein, partial [uncultured Megasphaera sp.]|uniref:nucleotidyltransferase family protein n=1 Tax=uncultured Megasphaera sp. TaxID=165188 RepID=UPI00260C575A